MLLTFKEFIAEHANDHEVIRDKHGNEYRVEHRPPYENGTTKNHEYTIHQKDTGHPIGGATFVPHKSRIMSVHIQPEHRRKGLATALYNHIEKKHNTKLVPNTAQTEDGQAFWKSRP